MGMVPRPGMDLNSKILRLDITLYGLQEAPLAWFETLSEHLAERGCMSLPFNAYLFIGAVHKIIVVLYVAYIPTSGSPSDINILIIVAYILSPLLS